MRSKKEKILPISRITGKIQFPEDIEYQKKRDKKIKEDYKNDKKRKSKLKRNKR